MTDNVQNEQEQTNQIEAQNPTTVEQKVEGTVNAIKESTIGKTIPTKVDNIKEKDLHFLSILMKSIISIPIFMISFDDNGKDSTLNNVVVYILYAALAIDISAAYIYFFNILNIPEIAKIGIIGFKTLLVLIYVIMLTVRHNHIGFYLLGAGFYLLTLILDFLHFFYSEISDQENSQEVAQPKLVEEAV